MYKATRSKNIYKAGTSYRVRKMINGKRESRYFKTFKEAILYRNSYGQ